MATDGQTATTVPGHPVLIVYGVPPKVQLTDTAGRKLGPLTLTQANRQSFETALKRGLAAFVGTDGAVTGARMVFIRNAGDFAAAVRSGQFAHVIYYGHALTGQNVLLPTAGQRITARQLAQALAGTSVTHFDILGCRSTSIAGELSTLVPGVRIGHIRSARDDNFETDPLTKQIRGVRIDPQPLFHFGDK